MAREPLPEEDAAIKRQVNRLHKSRPSDLSYMKRRHHLEWHRFRNYWASDRRRRRDRIHSLELVVTGAVGPASASLIDPFNGRLMRDPSLVELTSRSRTSTKVLVELSSDPCHDMLETGQLVFQVLHGIMENIDFGVLLPNHFTKVATLTKS